MIPRLCSRSRNNWVKTLGVQIPIHSRLFIRWACQPSFNAVFEVTIAYRTVWARPTLTAASGNVRTVRPTLFGKLKWLEWCVSHWRWQSVDQEYPFKAARLGDHFLSERPEKCVPKAGGYSVTAVRDAQRLKICRETVRLRWHNRRTYPRGRPLGRIHQSVQPCRGGFFNQTNVS